MLHEALHEVGVPEAILRGVGVKWGVDALRGERSAHVSCYDYGANRSVRKPGLQGKSPLTRASASHYPPRSGAEFHVHLKERDTPLHDGRTDSLASAISAICDWLSGADGQAVQHSTPFIDRVQRKLALLQSLTEPLIRVPARFAVEDTGVSVYRSDRSARLHDRGLGLQGVSFRMDWATLAAIHPPTPEHAAASAALWINGASLAELQHEAGVELFPGAALYERGETAAWRWANHALNAQGNTAISLYRPLIDAIMAGHLPNTARVFAHTSMNRLHFSCCSHFPFHTAGMPMLRPDPGASEWRVIFMLGEVSRSGDLTDVIGWLEDVLADVDSWRGSSEVRLLDPVNERLVACGSPLRAGWSQETQWQELQIQSGDRSCRLSGGSRNGAVAGLAFQEGGETLASARYADLDGLVEDALRWLELRLDLSEALHAAHSRRHRSGRRAIPTQPEEATH